MINPTNLIINLLNLYENKQIINTKHFLTYIPCIIMGTVTNIRADNFYTTRENDTNKHIMDLG
jgi:hypothetical protein